MRCHRPFNYMCLYINVSTGLETLPADVRGSLGFKKGVFLSLDMQRLSKDNMNARRLALHVSPRGQRGTFVNRLTFKSQPQPAPEEGPLNPQLLCGVSHFPAAAAERETSGFSAIKHLSKEEVWLHASHAWPTGPFLNLQGCPPIQWNTTGLAAQLLLCLKWRKRPFLFQSVCAFICWPGFFVQTGVLFLTRHDERRATECVRSPFLPPTSSLPFSCSLLPAASAEQRRKGQAVIYDVPTVSGEGGGEAASRDLAATTFSSPTAVKAIHAALFWTC